MYCKVRGGIVGTYRGVTFSCRSGLIVLVVESSCVIVMIVVEL